MNWTKQRVSVVKCVTDTAPTTITLGQWLDSVKMGQQDDTPKKMRRALLPHGVFIGGRTERHRTECSGLVQFDIDTKHNPDLCRESVKRRAASDPTIIMVANSAGAGCWGLAVRGADLDTQLNHLESSLGVMLDRCNSRSTAALRFMARDASPYLNTT